MSTSDYQNYQVFLYLNWVMCEKIPDLPNLAFLSVEKYPNTYKDYFKWLKGKGGFIAGISLDYKTQQA